VPAAFRFALMSAYCNAVSAELQKSRYHRYSHDILHEDLFINILTGKLSGKKVIDEKLAVSRLGMHSGIVCFVVDITGFDHSMQSVLFMREHLEPIIDLSKTFVHEGRVVVLKAYGGEGPDADERFTADLAAFEKFIAEHGMRCGVSRRFDGLENLPAYYESAVDALKIGETVLPDRTICRYDELVMYKVAELCKATGDVKLFAHPGVAKLAEYDARHATQFVRSLRGWIENLGNVTAAAKELSMHRNSLVYQLDRIEEIMGADLSDSAELQQIAFTLLL
jgi:sugar diacid utilization regulator